MTAATNPGITTLNRYFELSNTAGQNQRDLDELLGLFARDAELESARGEIANGEEGLKDFFRTFFARNVELHHVWNTEMTGPDRVRVDWAVAGRAADGHVFALSGHDDATVDQHGHIQTLTVRPTEVRPD